MNIAIVYPTFVKKGGSSDLDRLHEWSRVGDLFVINQGERIEVNDLPAGAAVTYSPDAKGTWGSQYWALFSEGWVERLLSYDWVIVCLQRTWSPQIGRALVDRAVAENAIHAHAWRPDIAASLSADPEVGVARALLECWLTAAAQKALGVQPGTIKDGFSGLLALRAKEYVLPERWTWTQDGQVNWGGALVTQLQALAKGQRLVGGLSPMHEHRTAASHTFSESPQEAFNQMVKKVAGNMFLQKHITQDALSETADDLPGWFPDQDWLQKLGPAGARSQLRQYLDCASAARGTFLDVSF